MAGYRSFFLSCKRGIVGHVVQPVIDEGPALQVRAARFHLRQAQRLLRQLGEVDLAEEAALLRDCVK